MLCYEIFDEARASDDRCAEGSRERAHVRPVLPTVVRSRELQADDILEYVRGRVDLQVQCAPQGDAHRRVVRRCCWMLMHDAVSRDVRLWSRCWRVSRFEIPRSVLNDADVAAPMAGPSP